MFFSSQALCQQVPESEGENNSSTRIIGGNPTSIEQYPFTVQVYERGAMICGGTIVSLRCVLTAAHCVTSQTNQPRPRDFSVRVGTSILNNGGSVHEVSTVVVHPNYNPNTVDSDLAILVLRKNVTVRLQVLPVRVAAFDAPDGAEVTIVGWGHTGFAPSSQILNEVRVRIVNREQCAQAYRPLGMFVTYNMFCAGLIGQGGADACQGDSGGPVLFNGSLVGVTSWGEGCGLPFYPGVKVRVSQYIGWIVETATKHNSGHTLSGLSIVMLILSLLASLQLQH
ncbi:hypothetical protein ACJJTC_007494 [Scirpophaga incertulas]